jgi:hypothetical protein
MALLIEQKAHGHIYARADFTWRDHPDGLALHCVGRRGAVVHVVRDGTRPEMWRIRHLDGQLSDMANLSWVKDGAIALAMRLLDPRKKAEQTSAISSPVSETRAAGIYPHPDVQALQEALS